MKPVWKKIPDNCVQHVWKKAKHAFCGEGPKTVVVSPGWYEENGTPICFCGEDMVYSHTEILLQATPFLELSAEELDTEADGLCPFCLRRGDGASPNMGAECPSCGRDNSEYGNVCTSDNCPANAQVEFQEGSE